MLEKDPKKRITIEEIKRHKLFGESDWDKLISVESPVKVVDTYYNSGYDESFDTIFRSSVSDSKFSKRNIILENSFIIVTAMACTGEAKVLTFFKKHKYSVPVYSLMEYFAAHRYEVYRKLLDFTNYKEQPQIFEEIGSHFLSINTGSLIGRRLVFPA